MIRCDDKIRIFGYSPEEYASQWGCGGEYDCFPNFPGDGVLFYNFSSENAAIGIIQDFAENLDGQDAIMRIFELVTGAVNLRKVGTENIGWDLP